MEPVKYTTKNPCTCKMLDASLGHVTKRDANLLADSADENSKNMNNPVCAFKKAEYGYFIYVPERPLLDEDDEPDTYAHYMEYGYSKEFVELMKLAINLDCGWINLDCDGTVLEDLPEFSW